jgi:hypothetical protein
MAVLTSDRDTSWIYTFDSTMQVDKLPLSLLHLPVLEPVERAESKMDRVEMNGTRLFSQLYHGACVSREKGCRLF